MNGFGGGGGGATATAFRTLLRRLTEPLARATPLLLLLLAATLAMGIGILLSHRPTPPPTLPRDRLIVTALNVGQGEASWIRTPDGHFIVIGVGPTGQGARVAASLKEAGAKKIDLLLMPYPYVEAIGGVPELAAKLPIVQAIEPGGPIVNQKQEEVRDLLQNQHIPVKLGRAGDTLRVGHAIIQILAPGEPPVTASPTAANNSLVVRLKWDATAFLWAGGLDKAGEEALLSREPDLSANWLRVARFASSTASSPEFLRLVSPETIVVSVGPNTGGYPSPATMKRLTDTGAIVYRTDGQPGPLQFSSDGAQVTGPF